MKSKKNWIITKAVILLLAAILFIADRPTTTGRLWLRMALLVFWTVSLIVDINAYKKQND